MCTGMIRDSRVSEGEWRVLADGTTVAMKITDSETLWWGNVADCISIQDHSFFH